MPNIGASKISFLAKTAAAVTVEAEVVRKQISLEAVGTAQLTYNSGTFGASAISLDGNSDYVKTTGNIGDAIQDGDYTAECWVYYNTVPPAGSSYSKILDNRKASFGLFGWSLYTNGSNYYVTYRGSGSTTNATITAASSPSTSTWYHLALVKKDTTLTLYLDGTELGNVSIANTTYEVTDEQLWIGCGHNVADFVDGQIDEVRISNTARYTEDFQVSPVAFENDDNTLLLVHANGTPATSDLFDDNGRGNTRFQHILRRNGNVKNSTTQTQFGDSSIYFDGTGDYIKIDNHPNFDLKGNDFTLECWINPSTVLTAGSPIQPLINKYNTSSQRSYTFGIYDGFLGYFWATSGGSGNAVQTSQAISTGSWKHIALCREGDTWNTYYDGTRVDTRTISGTLHDSTDDLYLGSYFGSGGNEYDGYADEFRISNTARYTGSSYTVPTEAFTNDANTVLLVHGDAQNNNTAFFDDAGTIGGRVANNGKGQGNSQLDTGRYKFGGSSALFDGSGDYIQVPYDTERLGAGPFTWECFFNVDIDAGSGTVGVLSNRYGGGAAGNIQMLFRNLDMKVQVNGYGGSAAFNANGVGSALAVDTWHHYVFCRDETNAVAVFVNGTRVASGTWDAELLSDGFIYGAGFGIGAQCNGTIPINSGSNGWIDGVRVSNIDRYGVGNSSITVPTERFVNDPNTHLLIQMDGSDGDTVFLDDNGVGNDRAPVTTEASGNTAISSTQSKFNKSASFDGSGDYLTIQGPNLGSGEWTMEMWVYFNSVSGVQVLYDDRDSANTSAGMSLLYTNGTTLYWNAQQANRITGTTTLATGTWYHIAVSRDDSNNVRMFLNGSEEGTSYTDTNTYSQQDGDGYFGMNHQSPTNHYLNAYIDEVRFSNTARYTAGFTAPTDAFTHDANTILLLQMDGYDGSTIFRDTAGKGRSRVPMQTNGNAQVDTAQYKFGNASIDFDGSNSYLTNYDNWDVTDNWTLEFFVRTDSVSGQYPAIFYFGNQNTSKGWAIEEAPGGNLSFISSNDGSSGMSVRMTGTSALTASTWHHVAIVLQGTSGEMYVDGTSVATGTVDPIGGDSSSVLRIGGGQGGLSSGNFGGNTSIVWYSGHLDDIRISNTARYTSAFTAPSTTLQNDANTLLLLHGNGQDGSTVIVDDNGISTDGIAG
jgi:hypothetical protein